MGDTLPNLELELIYESGGALVLEDSPTVTVSIARLNGKTAVKTGVATIADAGNGRAVFAWGGFTFNSPGTYVGQVQVQFSSHPISTQKFLIEVLQKVPGFS